MTTTQGEQDCQSNMGGPSYEVLILGHSLAAAHLVDYSILDIGCGDGRNALMLAGTGAKVFAVDRDSDSLNKLESLSRSCGRSINTVLCDATDYHFGRTFSAVIAHGLLHFLGATDAKRLVHNAQRHTRAGGYHFYTISHFASKLDVIPDFINQGHVNTIRSSDLCSWYADWETVLYDEYTKWDAHPGGVRHVHPISKLIFRKTGDRPLLSARKVSLAASELEHAAAEWVLSRDRIGVTELDLFAALGNPDRELSASASGLQFGFRTLEGVGYKLRLLFFGRLMFHISNGIVSGYCRYANGFTELSAVEGNTQ